ncbi:DUF4179 domain-containing protein [Sedimentibacter saalensis]|uniref:DUF4179 domain-containing protein n=1 Tax=Sedimentibacter saalensis TaxID=130788 RepID=UPI00289D0580|nr:DUF4179 domain-containing protein [Sedimentibacter saalensis]
MKKTDDLFDDFSLHEDINIHEENITEIELERIKKLTLSKMGLKKSTKKKFIIPLAASFILVLSFAAVFAQGGLSNIYFKLFGENIKYVNDMGTVIDKSSSSNGVTLNVANMVGDENSFYIIVELIKENGENFAEKGNVDFENLSLDFGGSGGYTWYMTEDENPSDNKATFLLVGNTERKSAGRKLTLKASNFTEYTIEDPSVDFDPYGFLKRNADYQNQVLVENMNKESMVIPLDTQASEEEKQKIEFINNIIPSQILPYNNDDIYTEDNIGENKGIIVDNIGFAEGKLCIRILREEYGNLSLGDFYFESKIDVEDRKYNEYSISEEYERKQYDYFIFDIKSMEELANYDFVYNTVNRKDTTTGTWEVTFKADYKNATRTYNVNKKIEVEGKRYLIKELKISPISLTVKLNNDIIDNIKNRGHNFNGAVSVVMKDGSTAELSSWGASTRPLTSTLNTIFQKPVDVNNIKSVIISGTEVTINK